MIVLLGAHLYTHKTFCGNRQFDLSLQTYSWAWRSFSLPRATYIFTDFDRLSPWELELAARLYSQLRAAGMRVLNDPARVLQRLPLLRRLHKTGINDFQVWRVEDGEFPDVFPVFLRTQAAHRGVLTETLETPDAADKALKAALDEGYAMKDLMFVQYCAEPVRPGLFRKLAGFRIGDRVTPALCVHEGHWSAKFGSNGIAGEELYQDEYDIARTNRYGDALRPAFDIAGIEYGRADFGLVGGKVQIYEINTNPDHHPLGAHPFPLRLQTDDIVFSSLRDGFQAIDTPEGGRSMKLTGPIFTRQRKHEWLMTRSRRIV